MSASPVRSKPASVTALPQTVESALHAMNAEFCVVERLPGIAVIPTLSDPEVHVYSRGELIQTVCSDRIVDGKSIPALWMSWPQRRKVKKLTYLPGQPQFTADSLNTWLPSPITPVKGDLSLWNAYLDHIFASDPTYRPWFLAWLAHQFQHPGVKLHTAVLFWSHGTGTGKSLFGYILSALFGEHNFSEISEGDLHGNFNFWAARKQFVMGEEIKGSNAQKHADYMKSLITRKHVTINTKNTPHYTLPDCINYFFTSNRPEAFYLEETDRRFFVHRLHDTKLDADYVNHTFYPWLRAGGYSAILYHLLHEIDLSLPVLDGKKFNPNGAAPQTAARRAMIDANRDEIDVWLEGISSPTSDLIPGTPWQLATAEELYECFRAAYPSSRVNYKPFVGKLRQALPMIRGGNVIQFEDMTVSKRFYSTLEVFRRYEGADLETLTTAYKVGR